MTEELANFQFPKAASSIIKVIGVGGGGCNAVNHMFEEGIKGVDYIICNTDSQAMDNSPVPIKIQLGTTLTEGRGAGNKPERGAEAARENYEDLKQVLGDNTKMLFIAAGMGGGTGTGAAPVIASLARELDILTIAVVTIPSPAEGNKRRAQAQEGIDKMAEFVDSMLVISNDRLHHIYGDLPASQAFKMADNIVSTAVKGVAEIITVHGNVNIDYTDVETVMQKSEVFIMGTGYATGEGRAMDAVNAALESPLLDSNDIFGTKNILLNIISGSEEIRIGEIGEIIESLQDKAGQDADIIWGNGYDERLGDKISVTILATGFDTNPNKELQPEKEVQKFDLDDDFEETAEQQEPKNEAGEAINFDLNEDEPYEPEPEEEETIMFVPPQPKPKAKPKSKSKGFGWKTKEKTKTREKAEKKKDEPVTESNIDNWFYKNFGSKIFNDGDDDQPLE
ncbi:cell division protein FtsZ [Draconibacterium orientale]|uniref:Cell division protein FtsZ n=1 Tax=Draconibacterium orientale TaxID=1168034 RepID=X5DHV6_9BACT|nr:cell division protein FtsZ [Draconibacterium orientale]AHW60077.1 cell division protein FtsZ [Draconibacterium orientale]SET63039.1 cell division protein FtsZ [Draconibacterium orientale]